MRRIAIDTNLVLYASGLERSTADAPKIGAARELLSSLASAVDLVMPQQVAAEFYNVVTTRSPVSRAEAAEAVRVLVRDYEVVSTTASSFASAVDLAARHQLRIWDAIVLAVAEHAGCGILLSEDFQDGFRWRGCTVVNPLRRPPREMAALLAG